MLEGRGVSFADAALGWLKPISLRFPLCTVVAVRSLSVLLRSLAIVESGVRIHPYLDGWVARVSRFFRRVRQAHTDQGAFPQTQLNPMRSRGRGRSGGRGFPEGDPQKRQRRDGDG